MSHQHTNQINEAEALAYQLDLAQAVEDLDRACD
jgi:hypothetical protein